MVGKRQKDTRSGKAWGKKVKAALAWLCCAAVLLPAAVPNMESIWAVETMGRERILICGKEEHIHTDACYTLTCTNTDPAHVHDASCYILTCGREEHVHTDECYTQDVPVTDSGEDRETPSDQKETLDDASADTEGGCTCGASADKDGVVKHAPGCPLYTAPAAEEAVVISGFSLSEPITLEVARGTSLEYVYSKLPETLPAVDENGNTVYVPVTWEAPRDEVSDICGEDAYTYGSLCGYGPWTFTASADPAFRYDGPAPTAEVSIPDCMEIASLCGQCSDGFLTRNNIALGETESLTSLEYYGAMMADGGYKNVPIIFIGSYDSSKAGTYRLEVQVEGDYTGVTEAWVEIVVEDYG